MSNCKSIRKCDEKITASELDVKVGDKFVLLPPEQSYNNERHYYGFRTGEVLEFYTDDGGNAPIFIRLSDGAKYYGSFGCLARCEESGAAESTPLPSTNATFIRIAEYQSAEAVEEAWGEEGKKSLSSSKIIVEGLTPEQYVSLINFISNMKEGE